MPRSSSGSIGLNQVAQMPLRPPRKTDAVSSGTSDNMPAGRSRQSGQRRNSSPSQQQQHAPKTRPPRTLPKKWPPKSTTTSGSIHLSFSGDDTSRHSRDRTPPRAPSSVIVAAGSPASLTRDLSDLSGSYLHGNYANHSTPIRGTTPVPQNVTCSENGEVLTENQHSSASSSGPRPWRQGHVLSRQPLHPQPFSEGDDSVGILRKSTTALVLAGRDEVEVSPLHVPQLSVPDLSTRCSTQSDSIRSIHADVESNNSSGKNNRYPHRSAAYSSNLLDSNHLHVNSRLPLILLLMDPSRKTYELLQIWVDEYADTARDVLATLQHNLAHSNWRQDYDGLFCVRNFCLDQLIHILTLHKYDVQPHEVWVAKPWAMSAKATVSYASTLLHHLKCIDVLATTCVSSEKNGNSSSKSSYSKNNSLLDTVLVLSKEAQKRMYVPDGILRHHHAVQFLSFSPSLEPMADRIDIELDDGTATSQLSESNCGTTSLGSKDDLLDEDLDTPLQHSTVTPNGLFVSTGAPRVENATVQISSSILRPISPKTTDGGVAMERTKSLLTVKHGNFGAGSNTSSDSVEDELRDDDYRRKSLARRILRRLYCPKPRQSISKAKNSGGEFTDTLASDEDGWWDNTISYGGGDSHSVGDPSIDARRPLLKNRSNAQTCDWGLADLS